MPTTDQATVRYRLHLAQALHSASPALSALHTSRVAGLHTELSAILHPSHCPKCGTYRFSGDHPSSLVEQSMRKKRRRAASSHLKAPQRRCRTCGFSTDAPTSPSLGHSSLPGDSSRTETVHTVTPTKEIRQDPPPGGVPGPAAETVQTTKTSQSSHTKTSTLKDMLSRDRHRDEVAKSKKDGREGLAAFLREL